MAYSLQDTTDLTALGNAIRAKTGGNSTMTVAEMASAVAGISGNGSSGATLPSHYITFIEKPNNVLDIDIYGEHNQDSKDFTANLKNAPGGTICGWETFCPAAITVVNVNFHSNNPISFIPPYFARVGNALYVSSVTLNVNLPNSVNDGVIGEFAFYNCSHLNIALSSGITSIDPNAFMNSGISITSFPTSISSIGSQAFRDCTNLTQLEIPCQNLYMIDQYAFRDCTNLTSVVFTGTKNSNLSIHQRAFNGCSSLTDIYVPWSENEIGNAPWGATNATMHYNYTPT